MTQIDVSEAELALLQSILHQAQAQEVPHPTMHEQECITEEPLTFSSFGDTTFSDLDLDLSIAGFHAFSLGLSSRKKERKAPPSCSGSDECIWKAPTPFPWMILVASIAVIVFIPWLGTLTPSVAAHNTSTAHTAQQVRVVQGHATSERIVSGPTITATYIEKTLCAYNTNLCGTGQALYDDGVQYHIDPAFALAFFWHESNFGTQGMAAPDQSLGNLRCIDQEVACNNGYAQFASWQDGYHAWFQLIAGPLYVGDGLTTIDQIIPRYAPTSDHNNEAAYIASVQASVALYRVQGGHA